MPSGNTIVANALIEAGVFGPGETLPAPDQALSLSRLNRMIDSWRSKRLFLYASTIATYSWTGGQASRSIGPAGNFVVTVRPQAIRAANYVDANGNRSQLNIRDRDWFISQAVRLSSAIPTDLYYAPTVPAGTIYLLPYPSATVSIELMLDIILASFAAASSVDLAPGYEEAITQSLAELLCVSYSRQVPAELAESARRARAMIQAANSMPLIPYKGFMGGAYQLDSPNASNQICQNFILEPYEGVPGKNNEEWRMKGTPACLLFKTIGSGPMRCQHFADKVGRAFVVSGTELYEVFADATFHLWGAISSGTGTVSMADDGLQLIIADGINRSYLFTFATNVFGQIADVDAPVASKARSSTATFSRMWLERASFKQADFTPAARGMRSTLRRQKACRTT
jgi:hypothetical protein